MLNIVEIENIQPHQRFGMIMQLKYESIQIACEWFVADGLGIAWQLAECDLNWSH